MKQILKITVVIAISVLIYSCATIQPISEEKVEVETVPSKETVVEEVVQQPTVEPVLVGYKVKFPFYVYKDRFSKENNYIPSGWMGDYGDIKLNENWTQNPKEGTSCIRIEYSAKRSQGQGWAGIYWQNPANNWGNVKGGFDLRGAKKLVFYARGEKGGEICEFKMGGIRGEYSDSDTATTGVVRLTKGWKKYTIDLKDLDLSYISGGFCCVITANDNPDGAIIYLDEIVYTTE